MCPVTQFSLEGASGKSFVEITGTFPNQVFEFDVQKWDGKASVNEISIKAESKKG